MDSLSLVHHCILGMWGANRFPFYSCSFVSKGAISRPKAETISYHLQIPAFTLEVKVRPSYCLGLLVASFREGVSVFNIREKENSVLYSGIPERWSVRVWVLQIFLFPFLWCFSMWEDDTDPLYWTQEWLWAVQCWWKWGMSFLSIVSWDVDHMSLFSLPWYW